MSNQENSNSNVVEAKEEKVALRGVLVNLDLAVAETFYSLARSGKFFGKKSPTAVARELINKFIQDNQVEEAASEPSE